MRIVSLVPSATEIAAALGAAGDVVGRSHECDHPAGIDALPALTRPRVPLSGGSAAIDSAVRGALLDGLAIYAVDTALLARLQPDVILTQDQCEVCAASLAQVEAAVCDLTGGKPVIVSLKPDSLNDIANDIARVGAAIGRDATPVVRDFARRLASVEAAVQGQPRPRLAFLEWVAPLMGPGLWTPELIARAGAEPVFGVPGAHTAARPAGALAEAGPDIIVVAPCGYTIADTLRERALLTALPGWAAIPAVEAGRVAIADGNAFFNRPGPRIADSAEILAEIVHGVRTGVSRKGRDWVWLHEA